MRWWEKQIGGTARGRIIALLRRGASTVEELAGELGVTDNAVRAHLQLLEREGLLRPTGSRQGPGAGKPATTYELSTRAEAELSSAYAPILTALLQILAERMPAEQLDDVLRQVGRRVGPPTPAKGSLDARVEAAAKVLFGLGSEVDIERTTDGYVLRGHACPLATAVRGEPASCRVVEELISTVVGEAVREHCDRTSAPRCRFEIFARSA
jgi:predicted ArsR family transcriptional regulator